MEAQTKTAEKIKAYVDRVDSKAQEIMQEFSEFLDKSRVKYQEEIQEIKTQAGHMQEEVKEGYEQRLQHLRTDCDKLTTSGRSLMETKSDLLRAKIAQLKEYVEETSHRTEEKWEDFRHETEELLETTRLAFQNFKKTFKDESNQG